MASGSASGGHVTTVAHAAYTERHPVGGQQRLAVARRILTLTIRVVQDARASSAVSECYRKGIKRHCARPRVAHGLRVHHSSLVVSRSRARADASSWSASR